MHSVEVIVQPIIPRDWRNKIAPASELKRQMFENAMELKKEEIELPRSGGVALRLLICLCVLMTLLVAAAYGDFLLVDGCPDIQIFGVLPDWQQRLYNQTFWPFVTTVVLLVGWVFLKPKKPSQIELVRK